MLALILALLFWSLVSGTCCTCFLSENICSFSFLFKENHFSSFLSAEFSFPRDIVLICLLCLIIQFYKLRVFLQEGLFWLMVLDSKVKRLIFFDDPSNWVLLYTRYHIARDRACTHVRLLVSLLSYNTNNVQTRGLCSEDVTSEDQSSIKFLPACYLTVRNKPTGVWDGWL